MLLRLSRLDNTVEVINGWIDVKWIHEMALNQVHFILL